jgi:hypothetical protein
MPFPELNPSRRSILRSGAALGAAAAVGASTGLPAVADESTARTPARVGAEKSMANVPFEGFDEVRVAIIGAGTAASDKPAAGLLSRRSRPLRT